MRELIRRKILELADEEGADLSEDQVEEIIDEMSMSDMEDEEDDDENETEIEIKGLL